MTLRSYVRYCLDKRILVLGLDEGSIDLVRRGPAVVPPLSWFLTQEINPKCIDYPVGITPA